MIMRIEAINLKMLLGIYRYMNLSKIINGDKVLLVIVMLLAIFSFLPVFSASSNLSYVVGGSSPIIYLFKHFVILLFGFVLMLSVQKIPFKNYRWISILLLPFGLLLLIYTASQGTMISGAYASRWINIAGVSFQSSSIASIILLTYVAHYLAKYDLKKIEFSKTIIPLWIPIFLYTFLILPSNLSTAALLFISIIITLFVSGYPFRHLFKIFTLLIISFAFFLTLVKAYPDKFPNRVDTWVSRIENFKSVKDVDASYQIERAKAAIINGGLFGVGAGKSVYKNLLPQSSSDFIFAIIIEEFGIIGGGALIFFYMLMLFRILVIIHKVDNKFGQILISALGLYIMIQAFTNISVSTQVIPVTGQNLPLISSGGSAAWITCISLGMILSVSSSIKNKKAQ